MVMNTQKNSQADCEGFSQPLNTLHQELTTVSPYVKVLLSQLDDILKETETGVLTAIDKANALDASYQAASHGETNPQSLEILSDLLGGLQFQDVIRQRLQQVCKALTQLDEHFTQLANLIVEPTWQGELGSALQQKLANFAEDYVMQSQVEAHSKVMGYTSKSHNHSAIELF